MLLSLLFFCFYFGCFPEVGRSFSLVGYWPMKERGIQEDPEIVEGLSAPLRAKAEQNDMAIAVLDVEGGSVAVEVLWS